MSSRLKTLPLPRLQASAGMPPGLLERSRDRSRSSRVGDGQDHHDERVTPYFVELLPGVALGREAGSSAASAAAARKADRNANARGACHAGLRSSGRDQLLDAGADVGVGPVDRPLDAEEDAALVVDDVGLGVLRRAEPLRRRGSGVVEERGSRSGSSP